MAAGKRSIQAMEVETNIQDKYQAPQTPTLHKEWRRYCIMRAIEYRRLGMEWKEAKRNALMCSLLAKKLLRREIGAMKDVQPKYELVCGEVRRKV